jgi:hypothetical protein
MVNPVILDFCNFTSLILSLSRPLSETPLPFREERRVKDMNFMLKVYKVDEFFFEDLGM